MRGIAPPEISLPDVDEALWPLMLMPMVAMLLVTAFSGIALRLPRSLVGGG
ncbi:MAG: hypothetical protein ACREJ5_10305 [Geminicoccaceae bacterium]